MNWSLMAFDHIMKNLFVDTKTKFFIWTGLLDYKIKRILAVKKYSSDSESTEISTSDFKKFNQDDFKPNLCFPEQSKQLLMSGVDINTVDPFYNNTIFHVISFVNGNSQTIDLCSYLLNNFKPQLNMKNKMGKTPLLIAVEKDNYKVVELLLNIPEVDVNLIFEGRTVLQIAALSGKEIIFELLLKRIDLDVNVRDNEGNTLLHNQNFGDRNFEFIYKGLLTRNDFDINARNKVGNTALHIAVINNKSNIVDILLSREDIDINAEGENGYFPLDQATKNQNFNLIGLLTKRGGQENIATIQSISRKIKVLENNVNQLEKNIDSRLNMLEKMMLEKMEDMTQKILSHILK